MSSDDQSTTNTDKSKEPPEASDAAKSEPAKSESMDETATDPLLATDDGQVDGQMSAEFVCDVIRYVDLE